MDLKKGANKSSPLYARVVVKTLKLVMSSCCFDEYGENVQKCIYVWVLFDFQSWFTCLPVVLKFMLSRFLFNQSTGRAEKIHEKFLFDRVIFMDRYCEFAHIKSYSFFFFKFPQRSGLLKDGANYCYCAYVLRISRYSGFLLVMLTNTVHGYFCEV